jgi:predicted HicB family RNase H-like nuclease
MPNQPKTPVRGIRVPDDLWNAALAKASARGDSLSQVIREALRKYLQAEER